MKKTRIVFRSVIFLVLLAVCILSVQNIFKIGENRLYQSEQGFYKEAKNHLDGVYIGASNVHAFWQPPVAWRDHGIAVYSFSVDSMPMRAVRYMIKEARKTQPDALYIININSFKDMEITDVFIHRVVDYLPFSLNKAKMIHALSKDAGIGLMDQMEFFFPIIRFHSGWPELESWDFSHKLNGLKAGLVFNAFFSRTENITKQFQVIDEVQEPDEIQVEIINELLDYCDREQVRVLFVKVPQGISSTEALAKLNGIEQIIQKRGYSCLDVLKITEELGIRTDTDFYNKSHTNVHGSLKYTDYVAKYLIDNYGFEDKRNQPGWESWDEAVELYTDVIGPYSLPFERDHALRDYELPEPKLAALKINGNDISVSWEETPAAEGYEIFRKCPDEKKGYWIKLADVDAKTLDYQDTDLKSGTEYTYTVVPVRTEGEQTVYGRFSFTGVNGKTAEENG